jgi:hypothetical protein
MPHVELLYFTGCPHIEAARTQLRAALEAAGLPAEWTECDDARGYGSPSILINGVDVLGAVPQAGNSCRVYRGSEVAGAPPLAPIVRALRTSE